MWRTEGFTRPSAEAMRKKTPGTRTSITTSLGFGLRESTIHQIFTISLLLGWARQTAASDSQVARRVARLCKSLPKGFDADSTEPQHERLSHPF